MFYCLPRFEFFPSFFNTVSIKNVSFKNLYKYTRIETHGWSVTFFFKKICFLVEGVFPQSDTWATGKRSPPNHLHEKDFLKGLFTPNDSVNGTVTLAGGTFDVFDGHCIPILPINITFVTVMVVKSLGLNEP